MDYNKNQMGVIFVTRPKYLRQRARRKKMRNRSEIGREQECAVHKILREACDSKGARIFECVIRHFPHSPDDLAGNDFTVIRRIGGELVRQSFGITISRHDIARKRLNHPERAEFFFTPGTSPETIIFEVNNLFP